MTTSPSTSPVSELKFGAAVRALMDAKSIKPDALGKFQGVDVGVSTVKLWLSDVRYPGVQVIKAIARGLDENENTANSLIQKAWAKELAVINDDTIAFGESLKALHKMSGLSGLALGKISGVDVTKQTIENWEKNQKPCPGITKIRTLVQAVGLDDAISDQLITKAWGEHQATISNPTTTFGSSLCALRQMHGLNQEGLGKFEGIDVSRGTISLWENEQSRPDSNQLSSLIKGLSLSKEDAKLLEEKCNKPMATVQEPQAIVGKVVSRNKEAKNRSA